MSSLFSFVIRARAWDARLARVLESVASQTFTRTEVVLVHGLSSNEDAAQRLSCFSAVPVTHLVRVPNASPGTVRNTGVQAAQGGCICMLEEEDVPRPELAMRAVEILEGSPEVAFVAPGLIQYDASGGAEVRVPTATSVPELLCDPWAIPTAAPFRKADWVAVQGFDEALAALECWDFWIRQAERGRLGAIAAAPLLARSVLDDTSYRRSLESGLHLPSVRRILARHGRAFEGHTARILWEKDQQTKSLRVQHEAVAARRARMAAELRALEEEIDHHEAFLRVRGIASAAEESWPRTAFSVPAWGTPVARYYVERFLAEFAADVRGLVLELGDLCAARRFGGGGVERCDVLTSGHRATGVRGDGAVSPDGYDCIFVNGMCGLAPRMVSEDCFRLLRPGGVLLAVFPGGMEPSLPSLIPTEGLETRMYGNVVATRALRAGIAAEELRPEERWEVDGEHPTAIGVRVVKSGPAGRTAGRATGQSAVVLAYRRVGGAGAGDSPDRVSLASFEAQMKQLRRSYKPVPLAELADAVRRGSPPQGAVAVTFDDGYSETAKAVVPVLQRYEIPATFFVATDRLDEPHEYWWHECERILLSPAGTPPLLEITCGGRWLRVLTATEAQRRSAFDAVYQAALGGSPVERDDLMRTLRAWSGLTFKAREAYAVLSAEEVRTLAASKGSTIGAQGVLHLSLTDAHRDLRHREIFESRSRLESLLDRLVEVFCYPYGRLDDAVVDVARGAGYACAVTREARALRACEDPLRLPRLQVGDLGEGDFAGLLREHLG